MAALIKYLNPGGASVITNRWDRRILNNGVTISPFGCQEEHSFTCKHCARVTFVKAGCDPADLGGRCTCCDALICKECVGKPCLPLEKKIDMYERRLIGTLGRISDLSAEIAKMQTAMNVLKETLEGG
jgi:hypothetical protein